MYVRLKGTGSTITWKSAERPKQLLGEGLDFLVCDEMAEMRPEAWYEYLRPCLSDRLGKALFLSRPHGLTWFYSFILELEDDPDATVLSLPSIANPFFPKSEWEKAKRSLPEGVFRQEYMGEFAMGAASVFDHLDDALYTTPLTAAAGKRFIGFDPGKTRDPAAVVVMDLQRQVLYAKTYKHVDFPKQIRIIEALIREWNGEVWIDSQGYGYPLMDFFAKGEHASKIHGKPVSDRRMRSELIEALALDMDPFFSSPSVKIPYHKDHPCATYIEEMVQQLRAMDYRTTPRGEIVYESGVGMHDDLVIALALANWGVRERYSQNVVISSSSASASSSKIEMPVTRKYSERVAKRGFRYAARRR